MFLAPWRVSLLRALDENGPPALARYVQLATVREDGRPANRTLVFRGFRERTDQLCFTIDARSDKAEQLAKSPWAEACWYFVQTREQFRLFGPVALVDGSCTDAELVKTRQRIWQELTDTSRLSFAWPPPGAERAADAAFAPKQPDAKTPLATFVLLILDAAEVDHLKLAETPQPRRRYRRAADGAWSEESINP